MRSAIRPIRLAGLATLLLLAPPALSQIGDTPQESDRFGHAVAAGDFNGDGYTDLVVGAPGEDVGSPLANIDAGQIHVVYGGPSGLSVADNQIWHQDSPGTAGSVNPNEEFGAVVVVGRFNADIYDDIAVGVPEQDTDTAQNVGAVHVFYGSSSGISAANNQLWGQSLLGTSNEEHDEFGSSLAVGDFNNDGYRDLVIGVPHEDLGAAPVNAGTVHVLYGGLNGFQAADRQFWSLSTIGSEVGEDHDRFGYALSSGDFDGDDYDDLAIGIPGKDVASAQSAGAVVVLYGTSGGLDTSRNQLWTQNLVGPNGAEQDDGFGNALASGDFNDDGFDDLVVGVPFEDIAVANVGYVNTIPGSATGLTSTGSGGFASAAVGLPFEDFTYFGRALTVGDFDGDGHDDIGINAVRVLPPGPVDLGKIAVVPGSASGLSVSGAIVFSQDDPAIEGTADEEDLWGRVLAAGDFDNDGTDDLVVGIPLDDDPGANNAGAVNILYGVFDGLDSSQLWYQGGDPVPNEPEAPGLPNTFALHAASPNPFRSATTLRYDVPVAGPVRLSVFDALGRRVAVLVDEEHAPGQHTVAFEARGLPSGLYLLRLEASDAVHTQRVTLLR